MSKILEHMSTTDFEANTKYVKFVNEVSHEVVRLYMRCFFEDHNAVLVQQDRDNAIDR